MEAVVQKIAPKTRQPALLSFDEYLKKEEKALHRHEFHNGKRIKITGGALFHNLLSAEFIKLLGIVMDPVRPDALVFGSDMKVHMAWMGSSSSVPSAAT